MRPRPWGSYLLRLLCTVLLFGSAWALVAGSTFALRMREDAPVGAIVIAVCALASLVPLFLGRRYLTAVMVSAFFLAGIGGYWWTTIPWDEFIKKSGFPTGAPATLSDYVLVAGPAIVGAFYAVVSHASTLRADLRARGADAGETTRVAATSFLAGAALLVLCGALAAGLWGLMASGVVFEAMAPVTGIPALVFAGALATVGYALIADRIDLRGLWKGRAGSAARARATPRARKAQG